MTAAPSLIREFESIDDYIKAAREILQAGHMPDLAGLDQRVSDLCNRLQALAPEEQHQYLARLEELLKKLDICEQDIRACHAATTKVTPDA